MADNLKPEAAGNDVPPSSAQDEAGAEEAYTVAEQSEAGAEEAGQRGEQATGAEVRTALVPGETFEMRPVQYTVVDGRAIFEGDILLGIDEDLQHQTNDLRDAAAQEMQGVGSEASPGSHLDPHCHTWTGKA